MGYVSCMCMYMYLCEQVGAVLGTLTVDTVLCMYYFV